MAGAFQFVGRFLGALTKVGPLTDGQVLVGQSGSVPLAKTISGDLSISALGVATILALVAARLGQEGTVIRARFATTTNDSLSGLAARDGVTPVAGDIALVKDNATGASKGLYVCASGAWSRLTDKAATPLNVLKPNILIIVSEGTANAGCVFRVSNTTLVVGTDTPTFTLLAGPLSVVKSFLAAASVDGTKIDTTIFLKPKVVTGHNGAGACTATGVKVGDKVLHVANLTDASDGSANFETTITVNDQIQQSSATDLSTKKHYVLVLAQS